MRQCGSCTLCCKLLEIHDIPSKIGEWCTKCDKTRGCTIHPTRPQECRDYQCMWSQMPETVSAKLRPSKCHIIFDKLSEQTICGMQDPDYEQHKWTALQIKEFIKQGYSVIIRVKNDNYYYLASGHSRKDIMRDFNDSSKLYNRSN